MLSFAIVLLLSACSGALFADAASKGTSKVQAQSGQLLDAKSININAATPATLASQLKGIGPLKAEAIVRYREKHGAFQTLESLLNVKGIGEKTLDKLRDQLIAGPYKPPKAGGSLVERERDARAAVQSIVQRSLEIRRAADQSE